MAWPAAPEQRDILYFLAQSFRAHLAKNLPEQEDALTDESRHLAQRAKELVRELADIDLEVAQIVVSIYELSAPLPNWFVVELVRDLPVLLDVETVA
jgi:hypothetical protein